jgi:hypothetical protein
MPKDFISVLDAILIVFTIKRVPFACFLNKDVFDTYLLAFWN